MPLTTNYYAEAPPNSKTDTAMQVTHAIDFFDSKDVVSTIKAIAQFHCHFCITMK